MKIIHISLSGPYNENWSYHENLLPFWHHKLGNDVLLIARNEKHEGTRIVRIKPESKLLDNGVRLIRLKVPQRKVNTWSKVNKKELLNILVKEKPDFIWMHGLMNRNLSIMTSYKKINHSVKIVADNHSDSFNYGTDILRRINLIFIKRRIKKNMDSFDCFYGVTPGRCAFLVEKLGVNKDKVLLSIQGGDPTVIDYSNKQIIRLNFREKHHIKEDDFIYITGGKLTKGKRIDSLLESFSSIKNTAIKLVIFGPCDGDSLLKEFSKYSNIIYIGFLNQKQICDAFLASDVGVFPGSHSVLWENALACGLPCLFGEKDGFEHLFVGGAIQILNNNQTGINFDFESFPSSQDFAIIKNVCERTRKSFLYDSIAKQTLVDNGFYCSAENDDE